LKEQPEAHACRTEDDIAFAPGNETKRYKESEMIKRVLLATAVAAALGASAPASSAVDIHVQVAPPAPRYEAVPAPRRGWVWVPGYWDWRGHRYAWVQGQWVRERPGYVYHGPRWTERGGRWHMDRGHWGRRDRDRDGVPNRFDRDRDGDGVPNRFDDRPDNPRRY
jgi:hypothetical protein